MSKIRVFTKVVVYKDKSVRTEVNFVIYPKGLKELRRSENKRIFGTENPDRGQGVSFEFIEYK